jgi:hypothetical protein
VFGDIDDGLAGAAAAACAAPCMGLFVSCPKYAMLQLRVVPASCLLVARVRFVFARGLGLGRRVCWLRALPVVTSTCQKKKEPYVHACNG